MKKNSKILLISIIVFFIILCISSISFAWSPVNKNPINPQQTTENGDYYCRQKGGAIRYTPDEVLGIKFDANWRYDRGKSSEGSLPYLCPCGTCQDSYHTNYQRLLDYVILGNEDLRRIWDTIKEDSKPIPLSSTKFKDYNGDLNYNYNVDPQGWKRTLCSTYTCI